MKAYLLVTVILLLATGQAASQHYEDHDKCRGFRAATFIGHTLIPVNRGKDHLFVPSWGVDLEYWFNERWAVGLHNDIELETFVIEGPGEETLERSYPIISTLDALYKLNRYVVLMAGAGYEFERNEDFFLFRFGVEVEVPIGHHWDVFPTVFYDTATGDRNYSTLTIGLGVGRHL